MTDEPSDRYKNGLELLNKIHSDAGKGVIKNLDEFAPDFAKFIIEYPFGDIYSRPSLDLRSRQIATIASLVTLGDSAPQLKPHIRAGLNVGLKKEEILEVILQMSVYAGFPRALNGFLAAKEVFDEIEKETEQNPSDEAQD